MRLALIAGLAAIMLLLVAPSAVARYLPYGAAYRAVYFNTTAAERHTDGADRSDFDAGIRTASGRVEFRAWLEGDELHEYVPGSYEVGNYQPGRFIYFHFRCDWIAAAHWSGRRVVVSRRAVVCDEWYDESVTQP